VGVAPDGHKGTGEILCPCCLRAIAWVKMNRWQSVNREEVKYVMGLNWFRMQGLVFLHDFTK